MWTTLTRVPVATGHTPRSRPSAGPTSSAPSTSSALLVGSATTMTEFCNACHGDLAPGASTNVVRGVFDSGPTGASSASQPVPLMAASRRSTSPSRRSTLRSTVVASLRCQTRTCGRDRDGQLRCRHFGSQHGSRWSPLGRRHRRVHVGEPDLHRLPRSSRHVELPPPQGVGQRRHGWWL